jgi:hypothetical protein
MCGNIVGTIHAITTIEFQVSFALLAHISPQALQSVVLPQQDPAAPWELIALQFHSAHARQSKSKLHYILSRFTFLKDDIEQRL